MTERERDLERAANMELRIDTALSLLFFPAFMLVGLYNILSGLASDLAYRRYRRKYGQ